MLVPLIVAVGGFMTTLDSTIITTALPQIAASLHVTPLRLSIAITSYLVSLAVFTPTSAYLADRFGTRNIFFLAIVLFTGGSALCGFAHSLGMLVAMRVLQGCGGGLLTPTGRLILVRTFARRELVRAMAYMVIPAVIGPTIGPIVGGYLATYVTWRWIFFVNIPVGVAGLLATLRYVENVTAQQRYRFDWIGFLLVGAGLFLLEFAIEHLALAKQHLIHWSTEAGLWAAAGVLMAAYCCIRGGGSGRFCSCRCSASAPSAWR